MDEARFDKQRRNVMATSSLLIAAWFVGADFSRLSLFGLTANTSHRIGFVWAILILYFMLRLYQITGKEQQDEKQAMFEETFKIVLSFIAKHQIIGERKKELREEKNEGELVKSIVFLIPSSVTYKDYKFTASFHISDHWKTAKGDTHGTGTRVKTYRAGQGEHELAIYLAKPWVLLRRKTFTEFTLPYILGFVA